MLLMISLIGLALADYPQENRSEFMQACTQNGGEQAHCTCVLERLEETVPLSRFIQADEKIKGGEADPEFQGIMIDVTSGCVKNRTYKRQFIDSCEAQGSSSRHCTCSLNHLVASLGMDRLKYLSTESVMIGPSQAMVEAMVSSQVQCSDPKEHEAIFVGSCVQAGSTETVCSCFHDFFVEKLGMEKLLREETLLAFGQPTPEFDALTPAGTAKCAK
jgi:hypothetical protein